MSGEDVKTFLLMRGCSDKKLKEEFFKISSPDVSKLLACAKTYLALRANQAAGGQPEETCATVQMSHPNPPDSIPDWHFNFL